MFTCIYLYYYMMCFSLQAAPGLSERVILHECIFYGRLQKSNNFQGLGLGCLVRSKGPSCVHMQ